MPIVARTAARTGYLVAILLITGVSIFLLGITQLRHTNDAIGISPIHWEPYSDDLRDFHLKEGRSVFVFVFAELSPESAIAFSEIDSPRIAQHCGEQNCETLLLRYDDWDDLRIRSVWKDVGHTKYPMLVLYSPNNAPRAWPAFPESQYADSQH
jgi:hypothetical protein